MKKISAFMDGETGLRETQRTLMCLKQHDDCRDTWGIFHLIGDVMRGDPVLGNDFIKRISSQLQQEPTAWAPRLMWRKTANVALSVAASLAALAVVLTLVITDNPLKPHAPIAAAPKTETARVPQTVAPPQPVSAANRSRVNEYLMAHQEFSPSTTLQGVAPYVRTVPAPHDINGK